METWFIILISLCTCAFLKLIFNIVLASKYSTKNGKLPPGPSTIPIIGDLLWFATPFAELEIIIRKMHAKYGPIITIPFGSRPFIFISNSSLAHKSLVQNGAVFANRPAALASEKIWSSNQHDITFSFYGPTWRLLRRNLTSEILHPSRIRRYSAGRRRVLRELLTNLKASGQPVRVVDHFRYAMFSLLALMCFGDKLEEKQIRDILHVQRNMVLYFITMDTLNEWPTVTKILFRKRWQKFYRLRKEQEEVLVPLIRGRHKWKQEKKSRVDDHEPTWYVDTLLDLELPDEKRKLNEGELVSLCAEFFNAGTDSTTTSLEWIMANLVKYPHIQEKLFMEIKGVVEAGAEEVKEEDLHKMPYLKAVVLEGLRRHPPTHVLFNHAVTEDTLLDGYLVPKKAFVNYLVSEIGWDPNIWEDPMAFKPERFLSEDEDKEVVDITGSKEVKMIPFGAGRRICTGYELALLHLKYFVANSIWNFEWKAVDDVDLTDIQAFTTVMKYPLQAQLSPRFK